MFIAKVRNKIKEVGLIYTLISSFSLLLRKYFVIRENLVKKSLEKENHKQLVTLDNNKKLIVDLNDDGLSKDLFIYGKREPIVLEQLLSHFKKYKYNSFIDIGANFGYYTVYLEEFFLKIYCIEPVPYNFKYLLKNINLNKIDEKCIVYKCAVGDEDKEAKILVQPKKNLSKIVLGEEILSDSANNGLVYEKVSMKKLSSIFDDIELKVPIFMRMDVEGFEYHILKSNINFFKEKHPTLFVEFHDELTDEQKKELLLLFKKLDYKLLCAVADFTPADYIYRSKKYGSALDVILFDFFRFLQMLLYNKAQRGVIFKDKNLDDIINEKIVYSRYLEYVFIHKSFYN